MISKYVEESSTLFMRIFFRFSFFFCGNYTKKKTKEIWDEVEPLGEIMSTEFQRDVI